MSMTIRIDAEVYEALQRAFPVRRNMSDAVRQLLSTPRDPANNWAAAMNEGYERGSKHGYSQACRAADAIVQEYQREYEAARAEAAAFIWHSLRKWGEPTQIDTHAVDCGCTYCN